LIATAAGLTFIEITGWGNLAFTTVFFDHKEKTEDFSAVISRHMDFFGRPLPSQYHGICQVWSIPQTQQSKGVLQRNLVRQAQERLKAAGFDPGPIDGVPGPTTKEALRQYQVNNGLAVTGEMDVATKKALGIE
jgi:hypothetical protein